MLNLGQWDKVALFPSSDSIVKNYLACKGTQSVSPVIIPALTTIVDKQFKEDGSLCPVCALRYYFNRTKTLGGDLSHLFISFKKGQQALDLVLVKAHDIGAIAASKAFYGVFCRTDYADMSVESTQHSQTFTSKI